MYVLKVRISLVEMQKLSLFLLEKIRIQASCILVVVERLNVLMVLNIQKQCIIDKVEQKRRMVIYLYNLT